METIIARGAEAVLYRDGSVLIKHRIPKSYRVQQLDEKIRKSRTRSETKLLRKLSFVPRVFDSNDTTMIIRMEFLPGEVLRDIVGMLSSLRRKTLFIAIGKQIAAMHYLHVIHGDLTTSNMILYEDNVSFIDFGLGFVSQRIEDKATDLRLLRQALESKHYSCFQECYTSLLKGYAQASPTQDVLLWLESHVEKRGRYKRKNLS